MLLSCFLPASIVSANLVCLTGLATLPWPSYSHRYCFCFVVNASNICFLAMGTVHSFCVGMLLAKKVNPTLFVVPEFAGEAVKLLVRVVEGYFFIEHHMLMVDFRVD